MSTITTHTTASAENEADKSEKPATVPARVVTSYVDALRQGHEYVLEHHDEVFVIGQGVWSPWYVGASMTDLDTTFGRERVIDTPVSEQATSGAALGAALVGARPLVVHPRVDFALVAYDQIVTQAAKWSSMFGGRMPAPVTFRCIINRGGQQGAQHSQAAYSTFASVPGLRVVTPATAADARDLLIASVLCDDPVVYIDDRWLYEETEPLGDVELLDLRTVRPQRCATGDDVTLVGFGYATSVARTAATKLEEHGIGADVWDLRVLNPLQLDDVIASVARTGNLVVVEADTGSYGIAAEVVARTVETLGPNVLKSSPSRVTLPDAPAPTSGVLEKCYYFTADQVVDAVMTKVGQNRAPRR